MHNHYFFLRQVSKSLHNKLAGWYLVECFSQNKNELVLRFYIDGNEFYIKADQNPEFSCLSFPDEFFRAKKNSIDLFPEIAEMPVTGIRQYNFERAFSIIFGNNLVLLFKLFGNLSNILLFENEKCIGVFKHNLHDEDKIHLSGLDHHLDLSKEAFIESGCNPYKLSPVFDKNIQNYLDQKGFVDAIPELKWKMFSEVIGLLVNPDYFILKPGDQVKFSLFPDQGTLKRYRKPLEAINHFYVEYQKGNKLITAKRHTEKILSIRHRKSVNYIEKTGKKLKELQSGPDYRQKADIIMANLNNIMPGQANVELFDFYNNSQINIKLNPGVTPQKNAENYYRKAKNQKIEINNLKNNIINREKLVKKTVHQLNQLAHIENYTALKQFNTENGIDIQEKKDQHVKPKFRHYEFMGFVILIGKNAKNNDELTFGFGYKEDLWFHARNVTGSHVLVKYQSGKKFPKAVIERAAQLAAWHSKYRQSITCPVIMTQKKFVRKSKGLPPGAVMIDKEEVIMVEPRE